MAYALFLLSGMVSAPAPGAAQTAHAASSEAPIAVLELYTSQGCSSCPPADALLQTYAAKKDIIALTLPVDYWDYLGWKDTLANGKFSARQRAYAKHRGDGRIYTPQLVINGVTHTNGGGAKEIEAAIAAGASQFANSRVPVQVRRENGKLVIETGSAPDASTHKDGNIWLAMIQREAEVAIKTGENRGKSLKYYNVVRELMPVGMWNGQPMTIRLDKDTIAQPGADGCAVLLQHGKAGPILGAAILGKF